MIRGWYYNKLNGERLLSVDEIASACGVAKGTVLDWYAEEDLVPPVARDTLLDAGAVVSFLVRHSIPVAPSLLPPKTRKILFIAADEYVFQDRADTFDHVCRFFAEGCNILVEAALVGKFADLSIFTFSPDVVVTFLSKYDPASLNTLELLSSLPDVKTVLLVNESLETVFEGEGINPLADLVVSDRLPKDQLLARLGAAFRSC